MEDYISDQEEVQEDVAWDQEDEGTEDPGIVENPEGAKPTKAQRLRDYLRKQLVADGYVEEDVRNRRDQLRLTDEQFGDGSQYISVADYHRIINGEHGVPVSVFVQAFGGDRAMYDPIMPEMQIYWHGRSRYLSREALQDHVIAKLQEISNAKKVARSEKAAAKAAAKAAKQAAVEVPALEDLAGAEEGLTVESLMSLTKAQLQKMFKDMGLDEDSVLGTTTGKAKKEALAQAILEASSEA